MLAPQGVVALLVPSPVADLDGYRPMRAALSASHAVIEPLLELGQDAFQSVTQPCFVLIAVPRKQPAPAPERPFVLSERSRVASVATEVLPPASLSRLVGFPRLPPQLFGEWDYRRTVPFPAALFRAALRRPTSITRC